MTNKGTTTDIMPSFEDIVKFVESSEDNKQNLKTLKIAFLRNITIDQIVLYTKYYCLKEKLFPNVYVADYDNVLPEVLSGASRLYAHKPEIIVVSLYKESLTKQLSSVFTGINEEELTREMERVLQHFELVLTNIRKVTSATVLVHNFEMPVSPAMGIFDYQNNEGQVSTFRRLNQALCECVKRFSSCYIVDIDILQSREGYARFFDSRYWHIGRSPYSREGTRLIAAEYIKYIRALKGKNKKCLVLDCDNTLWGGIIGEDGINNIKIGPNYPGSAFQAFQQSILNMYNRGVMLAICSKNNENDVLAVLENHPDMILRQKHFVSMKINWQNKAENLKQIAKEINIGVDSLVFIDDNPFEIELVNALLPEVSTILLPKDPSGYRDIIESCGLFDSLIFSEEDTKRNDMYQAELVRKKIASEMSHLNIVDYYSYLEMEAYTAFADDFSIPRISQLTMRTNQFNLTTKRYSEDDIRKFSADENMDVICLKLSDRFGDMGIIGAAVLEYEGETCTIDSFLMSCRAIGRGVEDVLLKECENLARHRGKKRIVGIFFRTEKNKIVETFLPEHGFKLLSNDGNAFLYFRNTEVPLSNPSYFKVIRACL